MIRTLSPILPTVAVDPGAGRSKSAGTGIVAVSGLDVVFATTLLRGPFEELPEFTQRVLKKVHEVRRGFAIPPTVAVEGVVKPSGHIDGRKSRVTPDALMGTGFLSGSVWTEFKGVLVRPAHHGEAHKPSRGGTGRAQDFYPAELCGRRPKAWPGESAGRGHEQEAFDIAFGAHNPLLRQVS